MKRNPPQNEFELRFMSKSVNEAFARGAVSAFLSQLDPSIQELSDIRTAVSEAVTNAIIHGYREQPGIVHITVRYYSDRSIYIRVSDKGCGISDIERAMEPLYTGDPSGERGGMGFTIMKSFMDELSVRSKPGAGTTVVLRKRLK